MLFRSLEAIVDSVYFEQDEYDAVAGSHAFALITEWNQFRNLEIRHIEELFAEPLFFDLRNINWREEAEGAGLSYFGAGT
jgi:UDPglucose 6-dehydrogenase